MSFCRGVLAEPPWRTFTRPRYSDAPPIIRKYDENQPRDEDGRWTATGGAKIPPAPPEYQGVPGENWFAIENKRSHERKHAADAHVKDATKEECEALLGALYAKHPERSGLKWFNAPAWDQALIYAAEARVNEIERVAQHAKVRAAYELKEAPRRARRERRVPIHEPAATVPVIGPTDGKTYYEPPPEPDMSKPEKKLAEFYRAEFISEHNRNGQGVDERYSAARKLLENLGATLDGKGEKPADMPDSEWSELVEATKSLHEKSAREWDKAYPGGGALYRGIRPEHAATFLHSLKVGDPIALPGFVSTSDNPDVADEFTASKRDKWDEPKTPGGVVFEYEGVKGDDLLSSYRGSPYTYTLPTLEKGGKGQMEHEVLLRDNRDWRVKSVNLSSDGYDHRVVLEPSEKSAQKGVPSPSLLAGLLERMFPRKQKNCVFCGDAHAPVEHESDCPNSMGDDIASRVATLAAMRALHKGAPPIIHKIRDDEGHEHGDDGKFTSGAGGSAKPKVKKPREKLPYETIVSYPHPQTGVQTQLHHAGGKSSWGGKYSDVAQSVFGGQHQRWDSVLLDDYTMLNNDQLAPYLAHVAMADEWMHSKISSIEEIMDSSGYMPQHRAEIRQQHKALYYDRARAHRSRIANMNGDQKRKTLAHIRKTAPLAAMIVAHKPKDAVEAYQLWKKARQEDPSLPELHPVDVMREALLYNYGMDMRDTFEGVLPPSANRDVERMHGAARKPVVGDIMNLDWAMGKTWKKLGLSAEPVAVRLGKGTEPGMPAGACYPDSCAITLGVVPRDMPWELGEVKNDAYVNTVAHEVAHQLSATNFKRELAEFNHYMEQAITNAELGPRQVMTRHGVGQKNFERGDYQEDWAIGLADFFLAKPATWCGNDFPCRQTVDLLSRLFDMPVSKSGEKFIDGLRSWPEIAEEKPFEPVRTH